jgi:hypothetical protein
MPGWSVQILGNTVTPLLDKIASQLREAAHLSLEFGATADYAPFVEFGTSRMAARSFIRASLDANQERILDAILTGVLDGNMLMKLEVAGQALEDTGKSIVVVRTGYLRSTIFHRVG